MRGPGALLLILLAVQGQAGAQLSGQVSLLSDYRQRGVSLSDAGPSLQAAVNYDHGSGFFAGAMASQIRIVTRAESRSGATYDAYGVYTGPIVQRSLSRRSGAGTQVYAGYAGTLTERFSWEVGAIDYRFPRVTAAPDYDYSEAFVGLGTDRFNVRLYRSHNYYGVGARMTYLEGSLSHPLTDQFSLNAHLGHMGLQSASFRSNRIDYRLGLGARIFPEAMVELAYAGTALRGNACPVSPEGCRNRMILSISHNF